MIMSPEKFAAGDNLRMSSPWQQIDWWLAPHDPIAGASTGAPLWAGWGAPMTGFLPKPHDPLPPATLDADPRLDLCPVGGSGWMYQPALAGYRPSAGGNLDWAPLWRECHISRNGEIISVTLTDSIAGLRWQQRWSRLANGRLWAVATSIENLGTTPFQLSWLASVTAPLPARVHRILTLGGPWAGEFKEQWDALPLATLKRDNRRGRSSHDCFPGAMLGDDTLRENAGEGWAVHLGFSGNHSLIVEPLSDGRRQLQIGELLQDGESLLAPNERHEAPLAYLAYSDKGLSGLSAAFHQGLREHILRWPGGERRPRPVHLNTWEAMYFRHDQAHLQALAEAAAQIGVERFVLDDGWFKGRDDDRAGLGDWWPDAKKYPYGLAPLAELVCSLGMEFGLWVEPEMVSPNSDLYRAHPDWVLALPHHPAVLGRHQLVLNLSMPEVVDYLFGSLHRLLSTLPISYLKWDMNRDLAPAAANGCAVHGKQVRALYSLLERLRNAHPKVEIESCASGGGRADFGILAHTHRVWVSDCNDALERIAIQRGFLRFFPPEIMGAHIGPSPAHTTGRQHRLGLRAAVASMGHLGVEADVSIMPQSERDALEGWITQHKRLRVIVHGAQIHQGETHDGMGSVAAWNEHLQAGVLCVVRVTATRQRYQTPRLLPWLVDVAQVRVRACASNDVALPVGWEDFSTGRIFTGADLAKNGLPLPPMMPESAWLLELEAVETAAPDKRIFHSDSQGK